jgi:protein-disulfide isomerase
MRNMMLKVSLANFFALLGLLTLLSSQAALAQQPVPCAPLNEEIHTRIIRSVARSAHTEPLLPTIDEETLVPGTCYWQLSLSIANTNRRLTVYLSPDRRFVFSTLLDVSADPWAVDAQLSDRLKREAAKDQSPSRGAETAPVTVVVFSDFQCPYCATFSDMVERYGKDNPNRIRAVFRNLPLPVHDWAMPAARAGACVSGQSSSAFWKFHDLLFSKQKSITVENLPAIIIGFIEGTPELQSDAYSKCIGSALPQIRLDQDLVEARSLSLDATPTIFINGRKYAGFRDDAAFALAINLATPTEPPKGDSVQGPKN